MVRIDSQRKINHMIRKSLIIFFSVLIFYIPAVYSSENDIYKKIDLFGEVLEKINKEYVDDINQSESMDSAINGLLQPWIRIQLTCHLKYLMRCKQKLVVNLVV